MTNIEVVENKISAIERYLKILKRYQDFSLKKIEKNIDLKGALERYLYLICQASIDLAESFIAFKKFRKPTTFTEAFYILEEEKVIDQKLTEQLTNMVGFRNIIAHDYEKLDYEIVYDVLLNKLEDIKKFKEIIKKQLK